MFKLRTIRRVLLALGLMASSLLGAWFALWLFGLAFPDLLFTLDWGNMFSAAWSNGLTEYQRALLMLWMAFTMLAFGFIYFSQVEMIEEYWKLIKHHYQKKEEPIVLYW